MDLRRFKYFLAVAEELNFSRAATRLHISQPPLSRQIRQLEIEMQVQLFIRTPKGVELTDAGTVFLEETRHLLATAQRAVDRAVQAERGKLGRLEVGFIGSAIYGVLPQLLRNYRLAYPDVELVLRQMTRAEQIEAIKLRQLHVGFGRLFQKVPDLIIETVGREPLIVVVSQHHHFSNRKSVALRELADQPFVFYPRHTGSAFGNEVVRICYQAGFRPNVVQITEEVATCIALVATGIGISIVPGSMTNLIISGIAYIPLADPAPTIDLSCIRYNSEESPVLKVFMAEVRRLSETNI